MDRPTNAEAVGTLVRAAQRGDRTAFRQLYERHKQRVFRTAHRLLGDRAQAEDILQEVFVTVYRRLGTFDFRSAFATWCYRITVNICYDVMRKQERRAKYHAFDIDLEASDDLLQASASTQPDREVRRYEVQRYIEHALQQLSPDQRATFVLREVEGLSYDEIASAMQCSPKTVSSRLTRARQQLMDLLGDVDIDETYFE